MNPSDKHIHFGTCSWSYPSWRDILYSRPHDHPAEYLPEYAAHYDTAEIDSWFYRMPSPADVKAYKAAVPPDFRFTCKVPREITLTHHRPKAGTTEILPNKDFLSPGLMKDFIKLIEPLSGRMAVIMLEFEYLNRLKMPSRDIFFEKLHEFLRKIPSGLPYAIEPRNGPWIDAQYFKFIGSEKLIHVYTEKQYMPHVYDLYKVYGPGHPEKVVFRLMGGDRSGMEKVTGEHWDRIVTPDPGRKKVAESVMDAAQRGREVYVNVNNHYEGSAPLTIRELMRMAGMISGK